MVMLFWCILVFLFSCLRIDYFVVDMRWLSLSVDFLLIFTKNSSFSKQSVPGIFTNLRHCLVSSIQYANAVRRRGFLSLVYILHTV